MSESTYFDARWIELPSSCRIFDPGGAYSGGMTTAILSFAIPDRVTLRCDDLDIDERRDLGSDLPFEAWSRLYATGSWSADALLGIGLAIGSWFDGRQQWLARLSQAIAPVILTIETSPHLSSLENAVLNTPWELVARLDPTPGAAAVGALAVQGALRDIDPGEPAAITELLSHLSPEDLRRARHLALDPGLLLTCVRRIGFAATPRPPSPYRLSVVFMAAQPDGLAGLAVDREEITIRRAAGGIGMDVAVEDCGSLVRLGELVAQTGECDVIHVSCHGSVQGQAVLALEGELGERADATAQELSLGIGKKPQLMFLSACATAGARDALWSLAADLCRRGWPAVLGWSCAVSDPGAIDLAAALYRQLALRLPLVEALAQARAVFADMPTGAEWHKARLFLGPGGGGVIVDGASTRPNWPDVVRHQEFLDSSTRTIPVARPDQPFPHRRVFQRVMAALRGCDYNGVVVYGGDDFERATFAARAVRRLERDLLRVVVARDFDAPAILEAIRVQTASPGVDAIAGRYSGALRTQPNQLLQALREIVEGPCQNPRAGAFALVVHGFDPAPAPKAPPGERRGLAPAHLPVARALIGAFAGARTASRLLFTSAAPFTVVTDGGDLADTLLTESLDPR